MNFAFSTNAYTNGKWTIIEAINKIAEAGFSGVEILMDLPLLWPPKVSAKEINKIKKTLQKRNLQISSLNAFTCCGYWVEQGKQKKPPGQKIGPAFSDYEDELRKLRIDYTKKVIDLAVELNAKNISTCSGFYPLRGTRLLGWKNMVSALSEVVNYAEKNKVNINIEYEPGFLVGSEQEAQQILKEISSDNFGLNFDIGHSFVCGENVIKVIKKFKNKINTLHIEDIGLDEKNRPVHYHLIPGKGKMPLPEIFKTLKEINYNGWCTVELYTHFKKPVRATKESMKYLKKIIN